MIYIKENLQKLCKRDIIENEFGKLPRKEGILNGQNLHNEGGLGFCK